jgi:polyhydroxybutyrate depolymerase
MPSSAAGRALLLLGLSGLLFFGLAVASAAAAGELDPLRPLTPPEVEARDRIRKGLLGNDPEGERAAIEARLATRTFETPPQLERRAIDAGGREREYFVFVPESIKGKPAPVVFALHGAGANSGLSQHWKSDYTGLAAKEGFVVVYPSGVRGWNWDPAAPARPSLGAAGSGATPVDDFAFFDAMFDRLIAEKIADPKRIYVTGGSGGGFMTWSLLFHRGQRIAAAGMMVALLPRAWSRWPPLPRPVPAIVMLGTLDPLVTWDGADRGHSAAETMKILCELDGCSGGPAVATLPDRDGDGNVVETAAWEGKAKVVLYRMNGHGHGWPMTDDAASGPKTRDFVPIEAFWSFLRDQRLE